MKPSRIFVHDSYDPSISKINNDIALIMLEHEVDWTDYIQPICLPSHDQETYSGSSATIAGWGFTNEISNGKMKNITITSTFVHGSHYLTGGKRPSRLQKLKVPVLENELCQKWYVQEKKSLLIGENSMCAGFEAGGKDACQVVPKNDDIDRLIYEKRV